MLVTPAWPCQAGPKQMRTRDAAGTGDGRSGIRTGRAYGRSNELRIVAGALRAARPGRSGRMGREAAVDHRREQGKLVEQSLPGSRRLDRRMAPDQGRLRNARHL